MQGYGCAGEEYLTNTSAAILRANLLKHDLVQRQSTSGGGGAGGALTPPGGALGGGLGLTGPGAPAANGSSVGNGVLGRVQQPAGQYLGGDKGQRLGFYNAVGS